MGRAAGLPVNLSLRMMWRPAADFAKEKGGQLRCVGEELPMSPDALNSLFSLCIGFSFAGALSSGYQLFVQRPAGFSLLQEGVAPSTFAAVPFLVFAAPFIIMRNTLRGARLEWNAEGEGGLVLVNPNSPEPEELGVPKEVMAAGLAGPLASRVAAVLEQVVNPSIAAHGGRADLVAMDESGGVAYLRLSGGCQGCAMSRMTLTQGIEAALREEVPEITRVVDVTDHSGGANPYY